jgi:hypothetical protein
MKASDIWFELMPIVRSLISPVKSCEMGDTHCKFSKNGKTFIISIKEIKEPT